jgi:hypothetical protein
MWRGYLRYSRSHPWLLVAEGQSLDECHDNLLRAGEERGLNECWQRLMKYV